MSKYSEQRKQNKKALGFPCVFYTNKILDTLENAKKYHSFTVVYDFGDFEKSQKFNSWGEFIFVSKMLYEVANQYKCAEVRCFKVV